LRGFLGKRLCPWRIGLDHYRHVRVGRAVGCRRCRHGRRVGRCHSLDRGRSLDGRRPFGDRGTSPFTPDGSGVSWRAVMAASAHRPGVAAQVRRRKVVLMSGPD